MIRNTPDQVTVISLIGMNGQLLMRVEISRFMEYGQCAGILFLVLSSKTDPTMTKRAEISSAWVG